MPTKLIEAHPLPSKACANLQDHKRSCDLANTGKCCSATLRPLELKGDRDLRQKHRALRRVHCSMSAGYCWGHPGSEEGHRLPRVSCFRSRKSAGTTCESHMQAGPVGNTTRSAGDLPPPAAPAAKASGAARRRRTRSRG